MTIKYDLPPDGEVRPVKFAAGQEEALADYLSKEIEDAINWRSPLERKWEQWEKQADSRRKREDARGRDSDIDMTLTREKMIQIAARMQNPVFQQDTIFGGSPRTAGSEKLARDIEYVLDEKMDALNPMPLLDEWIEQFLTFPLGVLKTPFVTEKRRVKSWQPIEADMYEQLKMVDEEDGVAPTVIRREFDDGRVMYFQEIDEEITVKRGCFPEIIPIEDFFFPEGATDDLYAADWVAHRTWPSKAQVRQRVARGIYRKKVGSQKLVDVIGEPAADREKLSSFTSEKNRPEKTSKQYEFFEVYVQWDAKKDGNPDEMIVVFDRKSKTIVRAVYNFYHRYHRPFIIHRYKKIQGEMYGKPLTYFLEPLHVGYTASFNQRLDAASKANETIIFVPPGHPLAERADQTGLMGGVYESPADKSEVFQLSLSTPFNQMEGFENLFEHRADRLLGLSGYLFGDEQISRPTASGQVQLIEEAKQPQYVQLEQWRETLAELAKHILARERQFNPEGLRVYRTVERPDPMTGQMVETIEPQLIEWPEGSIEDDVLIEVKVTSAQMSKSLRKQEIIALIDKLPQMYQLMMGMVQTASDPMNPAAMMAASLLRGYQVAVDKMLTEFEVSQKGTINPDLIQEVQVAQQIQQVIQQLSQQVQGLGAQNAQLQQQLQQLQAFAGGGGVGPQGPGAAPPVSGPPGVPGGMPGPQAPQGNAGF